MQNKLDVQILEKEWVLRVQLQKVEGLVCGWGEAVDHTKFGAGRRNIKGVIEPTFRLFETDPYKVYTTL